MFKKEKLFLKIVVVIALIILIFAIIVLISYEMQYKSPPLINNNKENKINIAISVTEPSNNQSNLNWEPGINPSNQAITNSNTLEVTIIPDEPSVSGFLQITIDSYPDETDEILIMVSPKNSDNPTEDENSLINFIEVPFNKEFVIDTKEFPNGEYLLIIASTKDSMPEDEPWTSIIRQEITISN